MCMRTPFTLPSLTATVGLSLMNSPSTTGAKINVPKKAFSLIAALVACKVFASRARRQARVSVALEHLFERVKKTRYHNILQNFQNEPSTGNDNVVKGLRRS